MDRSLAISAEQAGPKLRLRDGQNVDCDSASDNHGCINNLPQKSAVDNRSQQKVGTSCGSYRRQC